ncbi:hypothetical protein Trydic_g21543 [Trypoxylus dichotomus]
MFSTYHATDGFFYKRYFRCHSLAYFSQAFPVLPLAFPDRKILILWVSNFRANSSALKGRGGKPCSGRTPESIGTVRHSIQQSLKRSIRKHAAALQLSDGVCVEFYT